MRIGRVITFSLLCFLTLTACGGGTPVNPSATDQSAQIIATATAEQPATEAPAAPELITLKMNSAALTSYAPIFIADEEGYFEEEGLKIEYITFNRSTDALPLIITGDLDIFAGAVNSGLLNILGQEENIKVVADRGVITPEDSCANQGIVFRKSLVESGELTGPADLKGRTIAATTSGPSGYLLSLYLAQAGLTFDDVTISDVPTAGYVDAMTNGTVDAIVTPELRLSNLVNSGVGVLGVGGADVYGTLQSSVVVFGKSLLQDNREAGVRFLKAYLRGIKQYQEGKTDRNVAIIAKYTETDEQVIRDACWITVNLAGRIDFDKAITGFQQWSIEQGQLDKPVTEEQFWDPSLLEEALAQMK